MSRFAGISICMVCLLLISCGCVHAIPAFARREGVACQMCHFRLPELNKDGHDYARRGLREEPPGFEMGTEPGESGEESGIPADTEQPLGVPLNLKWANYLTMMGHHMFVAETDERPLFSAGELDIWAAGPIDRHWTGLGNPSFDLQEGGSDADQAYGQYITQWAERFGSARYGLLIPFAILFNQGGPKMPLSDPLVLSVPGDTGYGWTPESSLTALDLGAVNLSRATFYLGAGQPKLEDSDVSGEAGFERHTDLYASGEWIFTPEGNSLTAYGYWGSAWLSPTAPDESFHRFGLFGNVYIPRTKITLGYLTGSDDDALGNSLDNSGYFGLAEYLLSDKWAAYLRYDHFKRDLSAGGTQTLSGSAIGASWWAQTQMRLTFEGQFLSITDQEDDNRFMTEFMWAF